MHSVLTSTQRRPAKFVLVAGFAAVVHLLVAQVLLLRVPSMAAILANGLAFIPAVLVSYLGHRHVTFGEAASVLRFFLLATTGFALNTLVLLGAGRAGVPASIGVLVSAGASPVLMYLGCRHLVFSRKTVAQ